MRVHPGKSNERANFQLKKVKSQIYGSKHYVGIEPTQLSSFLHCIFCRFSSAEMACAVVVTHVCTLLLCVAVVVLHRSRRRLRGLVVLKGGRQRPRREVCTGALRAAYERRGNAVGSHGCLSDHEKTVMSLDRGTSDGETVSFKRGVRQYTLNDYYASPSDVR